MLEFIKKLFRTESKDQQNGRANLMDNAPFLSPWYLQEDKPILNKDDKQLNFKSESETITLNDNQKNCLGVIEIYSYILPSEDNQSFLIWNRSLEKVIGLQTITIKYYETNKLTAIENKSKKIFEIKKEKLPYYFNTEPTAEFSFKFNPNETEMKIEFPEEFKKFKHCLLITELENLYYNPNPNNFWHNTTILELNLEHGFVYNYPQDWFNKGNGDFGYQWITRAIRNPRTNLIEGQGIRISDFILDNTNRQLKKLKND